MTSPHWCSVEEQRHRVATAVISYLSAYHNCGHVISARFKILWKSPAEMYEWIGFLNIFKFLVCYWLVTLSVQLES